MAFGYPRADEISLASLEIVARADSRDSGPVLTDISFAAEPGQMIALVGPSGAGKTTITHLVARLYDVGGGAVRVGGHDVRDVTLQSLEDVVGYVTQDAHMFHDTIRANLLYARPGAADPEVWAALEAAQIATLVRALPDGLDTVVGDRGYRLSGGERQRLAIARLLLKAPAIVVLDEATAHLDSESEAAVQRALDAALEGRTSLVIAHRLSTVRNADQILVVDGGRDRPARHPRDPARRGWPLRRPLPHPVRRGPAADAGLTVDLDDVDPAAPLRRAGGVRPGGGLPALAGLVLRVGLDAAGRRRHAARPLSTRLALRGVGLLVGRPHALLLGVLLGPLLLALGEHGLGARRLVATARLRHSSQAR